MQQNPQKYLVPIKKRIFLYHVKLQMTRSTFQMFSRHLEGWVVDEVAIFVLLLSLKENCELGAMVHACNPS
jgi:hypothetical protein